MERRLRDLFDQCYSFYVIGLHTASYNTEAYCVGSVVIDPTWGVLQQRPTKYCNPIDISFDINGEHLFQHIHYSAIWRLPLFIGF